LAEILAKEIHVHVFHYSSIIRKNKIRNNLRSNRNNAIKLNKMIRIPFNYKYLFLDKVESFLNKILSLINIRISKYDIFWFTSPKFLEFINLENIKRNGKLVIYDCMDDILEFPQMKKRKNFVKKMANLERRLLSCSDIIFTSAYELKKRLIKRGEDVDEKIYVINNALNPLSLLLLKRNEEKNNLYFKDRFFNIVYYGMISEWLDFDSIGKLIKLHEDIRVILVGPSNITIPRHERIIYIRPMEHEMLINFSKNADCLIMPFKINNLILGVDPVKLYEYIGLHKNIIAVEYDEIKKFKDFVYFYKDFNELNEIIIKLKNENLAPKYTAEQAKEFIEENTWTKRVEMIIDLIENVK
ncbi:MAG: hypothetical protein ACTSQP_24400, partial [Promethearchaeota archaeon]